MGWWGRGCRVELGLRRYRLFLRRRWWDRPLRGLRGLMVVGILYHLHQYRHRLIARLGWGREAYLDLVEREVDVRQRDVGDVGSVANTASDGMVGLAGAGFTAAQGMGDPQYPGRRVGINLGINLDREEMEVERIMEQAEGEQDRRGDWMRRDLKLLGQNQGRGWILG